VEDGKQLLTYCGHRRFVRCIAWSPDSSLIASSGDFGDSTVQVWHAQSGLQLATSTDLYRIFVVCWSPDGQRLAACSFADGVHTWRARQHDQRCIYTGHSGPVYTLAWAPDGRSLASSGQDGQVHIWEDQSRRERLIYRGHSQATKALAWSPDGSLIASGGDDTTLRIWQTTNGEDVLLDEGHDRWIRALCWSPDGQRVASASGQTIRIISLERP
jgi:hypothetical protein